MTNERFLQIRDTYSMEDYTLLSDLESSEFSTLTTEPDLSIMLKRWGHVAGRHFTGRREGSSDNRPLRTIIGRSDNGRNS